MKLRHPTRSRSLILSSFVTSLAVAALTLPAPGARAHEPAAALQAERRSDFHADFEVDPTAYVLRGYSLHVGLGWKRLRLDLGAFALALPAGLTGNDDFAVAFDGYGAKLQYFLFSDEQRGGFVGVDAGVARPLVQRRGTELHARHTEVMAGVNFGWRFVFLQDFYATAWLGLSRTLNAHDVTLAGSTYEPARYTVFPAVHLGYRFR